MNDVLSYNPDLEIKGHVLTDIVESTVNSYDSNDSYEYSETIRLQDIYSVENTYNSIKNMIDDCDSYLNEISDFYKNTNVRIDNSVDYLYSDKSNIKNNLLDIKSDKSIDCYGLIYYLQEKLKIMLKQFVFTMYGADISISEIKSFNTEYANRMKYLEKNGFSYNINYYVVNSNNNICEAIIKMIEDYRNILFLIRCKAVEITPQITSKLNNVDIMTSYFDKKSIFLSSKIDDFDITFKNLMNIYNTLLNKRNSFNSNLNCINEIIAVEFYSSDMMEMLLFEENEYNNILKDYIKCSLHVLEILNSMYDYLNKNCDIKYIYSQVTKRV